MYSSGEAARSSTHPVPVVVNTAMILRDHASVRSSSFSARSTRFASESADSRPTYTRIGSIAGPPLKSEISCTVGPTFSPSPVKSRPCTPSVFHGTSDAGLPLRSGCVGWRDARLRSGVDDGVRRVQRVERGIEQEALDHADHDARPSTRPRPSPTRRAVRSGRSTGSRRARSRARVARSTAGAPRRRRSGSGSRSSPTRSSRSCPSGRARRSATSRPSTRNSGTSTTVAPSRTHHAMRLVARPARSIAASGCRPRAHCRRRSRSRR